MLNALYVLFLIGVIAWGIGGEVGVDIVLGLIIVLAVVLGVEKLVVRSGRPSR